MAGDIEEFLRRAAERRKQQGRGGKAPSPPPPPAQTARKPLFNDVIDAEIIEADPVSGDDVADEVSRHLDNREFLQRTAQLGEAVRAEAQNLESNVQRDFGPRPQAMKERPAISTTSRKTTDTAAVVTSDQENALAVQLLATLSNPAAIRQAIVLSEIFNRPEHRW